MSDVKSGPSSTFFLPAEREDPAALRGLHVRLARQALLTSVLDGYPEPAVVTTPLRQVLLANQAALRFFGVEMSELLGQRLGESTTCVNAHRDPAGCGTTAACRLCGAAQAVEAVLRTGLPQVGEWRVARGAAEGPLAFDFEIAATPLSLGEVSHVLCVLRDLTDQKRRQALERIFFHDTLNTAGGLKGIMDLWPFLDADQRAELSAAGSRLAQQLVSELEAQRDLAAAERGDLVVQEDEVDAGRLLVDLCALYQHHPIAQNRHIRVGACEGLASLRTDRVLVARVIGNLLRNALEASALDETVTLRYDGCGTPAFAIHNPGVMPPDVQLQIFQRSFSTKPGRGRGLGTYSVRLLTERYLGGQVDFRSVPDEGTTFFVRLPGSTMMRG